MYKQGRPPGQQSRRVHALGAMLAIGLDLTLEVPLPAQVLLHRARVATSPQSPSSGIVQWIGAQTAVGYNPCRNPDLQHYCLGRNSVVSSLSQRD